MAKPSFGGIPRRRRDLEIALANGFGPVLPAKLACIGVQRPVTPERDRGARAAEHVPIRQDRDVLELLE
jgi:hypothetical protein